MTLIGVAQHDPKKLSDRVNQLFPGTEEAGVGDGQEGFGEGPGDGDFVKKWWEK